MPIRRAVFYQQEESVPFMFSLEQFHRTYETVTIPIKINGYSFNIYSPASIDRFIDEANPTRNFPLWAKVWEASIVLATYLSGIEPDTSQNMLEIGCGLGLAGIASARTGHRITMTEVAPDALNFAKANALSNGYPDLPIHRLDWNVPELDGRFDCIIGSETVYRNEDIDILDALFERYLTPGGQILLAESVRSTGIAFWERMQPRFHIQARRHTLRSDGDEQSVVLFRLRHKTD